MNIQEAKEFFQSMGCSYFHMVREEETKYREYGKLGISKEQELLWIKESFEEIISNINNTQNREMEYWWAHSNLSKLAE